MLGRKVQNATDAAAMSYLATVNVNTVPVCGHCRTRLIQRCTSVVEGYDSGFLPVVMRRGIPHHACCVGVKPTDAAMPTTTACLCGNPINLPHARGQCVLWYDDRDRRSARLRVLHAYCVGSLVRVVGNAQSQLALADRSVYDFVLYAAPVPKPGVSCLELERGPSVEAWLPGASLPGSPPLPIHISVRAGPVATQYAKCVRDYLRANKLEHMLRLGMLSVVRRAGKEPSSETMGEFMETVCDALRGQGATVYHLHTGAPTEAWFVEASVSNIETVRVIVTEFSPRAIINWFPWLVEDGTRTSTGIVHVTEVATLIQWHAEAPSAAAQPSVPQAVPQ